MGVELGRFGPTSRWKRRLVACEIADVTSLYEYSAWEAGNVDGNVKPAGACSFEETRAMVRCAVRIIDLPLVRSMAVATRQIRQHCWQATSGAWRKQQKPRSVAFGGHLQSNNNAQAQEYCSRTL
jgi:hypothetical protein